MFLRRVALAGGAALFAATVLNHNGEASSVSAVSWPPAFTRSWDHNWDRREPMSLINLNDLKGNRVDLQNQLKKYKAKARRHIFLVRHGQYNVNGETDSEKVLTQLGREQANLTGQRLANLGFTYNGLTYSTMQRAKETSEIIGQHLDGVTRIGSDLLREGAPIRPDPPSKHWKPDAVYFDDGPRIESAFRSFIHRADYEQKDESYEIIVCHDNVIRYIVCRALQVPPEAWLRMDLNHGSITELVIHHNGRVTLRMLGDAGYMPASKLSS
ncbi:serine/threonine-protein phosphatase PGAM5, mitochondrial-like [Rana temporaria]|uniref:serine/threonine-protein phosphatase PGAM5, mitochondrial-like n=1 Tax=Rana temporaria TaxID=8407 RepID=UPI001AAD53A9|nr:serine/threonine-protein phosphatase PGAM5, mitochondrial-like [Rana temporaria]